MDSSLKARWVPLVASVWLALAASTSAAPPVPERYAGIEIGSKGVKAVVMDLGPAGATPVMESISNTTLAQGVAKSGVFSKGAIRDTADEAGKFAGRIRDEFHVPADRVCVIGSSGLPNASNRDELVAAVAEATKLAPLTFISPADEVKLTIRGSLTTEADRAEGLVVDVGSGNTKGGFLGDSGVVDFSVPFGSVTFENRVAAEAKAQNQSFAEAADRLRPTLLESEIAKQVKNHSGLSARKIVFLSGGAAYAMVSLTRPEAALQKHVDLSARDIAAYSRLVHASPIKTPALDDPKDAAAKKEVKNVLDVFTPTNLIAGAELLRALSSALDFEHKTLRFDRSSVFAVSRGKVLELAEKNPKPTAETPKPPVAAQVTTAEVPNPPAEAPTTTAEAPKPPIEAPKSTVEVLKPAVYPSPQSLPQ